MALSVFWDSVFPVFTDYIQVEGYDYIQYVRKPFAIVNHTGNKAVDECARPWFSKIASDPRCARCFCKVAGLLFYQRGPVHYGCLVKSEEYYEHPGSHARALRGSLYSSGCGGPGAPWFSPALPDTAWHSLVLPGHPFFPPTAWLIR